MTAIANGISLHGGFLPYTSTFLMFVEYARNAVRMAALMKQRQVMVYTHDSIGLGEDGPTHQPVEQIASLRVTPNMSTWRPCDQVESAVAWKYGVERQDGPTALILSRQNLAQQERTEEQLANIARGGYVLKDCAGQPELIFIATGSEVELAVAAYEKLTAEGVKARVAPILYMEGACGVRLNADDDVSEIFKNGRASISLGYIGIHETINALFGGEHVYDNEQLRAKGIAIVERLRQAVDQWKEETGYGFSLYSTPSENLCDRFCRLDTAEFGVVPGVTDKGYYTNSFHLDVEKKVNPYDKIDFEAPYPPLANGGFICYGEYPNIQHNLKALEDVWDYSYQHVPYYGTNTPIDECYECGFTGEFECTSKGFTCPKCGNHDTSRVSVTRRVCGYLGSPDARPFNAGKQEEVKRRVKHLGNGQIG